MEKRKLSILYVAHEGHMGGASKSLLTLAKIMKSRGHNVTVLVPFKNSEMYRKLEENEIATICNLYMWWQYPKNEGHFIEYIYKLGYGVNRVSLNKIVRKVSKYKFDIIHSNSSVIEIGLKISEKLNIPHVWHFREFGKEDLGTEYIKGREKSLDIVNKSESNLIYISNAMKEYYSKWIDSNKGLIIYNGIGQEYLFEKTEQNYNTDGVISFLISGALQPGKGQEAVIKAVAILKKQGISNFKVFIAGRSIADYDKVLKRLCEKEKITDNIVFIGFVENMLELRKKMDVELVCSKKEAFGRVTVEAMMSSNPVIASRSGANPELVEDGVNGFLYSLDSVDELAECMKKMINNTEQMKIMGKNAYSMSKDRFTAEKNAIEIEKYYYQILQK